MNRSQVAERLREYKTDGYTVCRNVLDGALIDEVRQHHQWALARAGDVHSIEHFRIRDVFIARLVSDPRLLNIVEAFIGPDIGFFGIGHWYKPAHTGLPVLWHQDIEYWPLDPPEVVTLWLAATDSTVSNGCMEVLPGSHRSLRKHHIEKGDDHAFFDGARVAELTQEEQSRIVPLELNAGDLSIHHPQIVHGSKTNTSPDPRFGLSLNYIPTHVTIKGEQREWNWLLRGKDRGAGHTWMPFPEFQIGEDFPFTGYESWAAHRTEGNEDH